MRPAVAIVEDEEHLREAVAEYLEDHGLRVLALPNAAAMRALAESQTIDIAVLDIVMPGEDGLSLARWLRARGERPGIILATALGAAPDRVAGIELGADDYVVKPYDLQELLARIRSVLRRLPAAGATAKSATAPAARPAPVHIGGHSFDFLSHQLLDPAGQPVELTAAEAALLAILAARPNRILSRSQLLELTGADGGDGSARAIDVRVARLRSKLRLADEVGPIRTVRGEGYMLVPGSGA
jgi:two-component system phosphate regulon response regulator OmpR